MPAWAQTPDGLLLAVRVTPRGGRDAVLAGTEDRIAVRLAAAPVDGAANAALVAVIARHFDVSRSAVTITAGQTGRNKRIAIAGNATVLAEIAASLYGAAA